MEVPWGNGRVFLSLQFPAMQGHRGSNLVLLWTIMTWTVLPPRLGEACRCPAWGCSLTLPGVGGSSDTHPSLSCSWLGPGLLDLPLALQSVYALCPLLSLRPRRESL